MREQKIPISVWAPFAGDVTLRTKDRTLPLKRAADGWWRLAEGLLPDTDYAFFTDGRGPFPDPRSMRLPNGVHGPSRTVDHGAYEWSDSGWRAPPLASGVIYELHAGTFTKEGTFDGVIERLDYLCDLGITHIELMPVNSFSGTRGWGYDGVGLFAPQESYGGPEGLKRLVDACHGRGIAVILDVVYNHLGPEGNYLEHFGPYFAGHYSSAWGDAVNLDGPYSHEVRRFFIDNALMWLSDYHLDGLRIDAVHALIDTSAIHFLEELAAAVRRLEAGTGRPLTLIAESDLNDPRVVTPTEANGMGIDAQWSDDFHHAVHAVVTGEQDGYYADFGRMEDIARACTEVFVYGGRYSPFRKRVHGRPVEKLSGTRFLGYIQNHDQIGNRAGGERIGFLADPGRIRAAAALVFFAPFVPMIFQGEEWGATTPFHYFTDHADAALGEAVREGRAREFAAFGWRPEDLMDPQAEETFARSVLNWKEADQEPHRETLRWYRDLIGLRKARPCLKDGRLDRTEVRFDETAGWIAVSRGKLLLACNFGQKEQSIPLENASTAALLLWSPEAPEIGTSAILVPANAAAIISREAG